MAHRLLDFATVYHIHNIVNGDAGLRNVGGNHNFPYSLWGSIKHLQLGKGMGSEGTYTDVELKI